MPGWRSFAPGAGARGEMEPAARQPCTRDVTPRRIAILCVTAGFIYAVGAMSSTASPTSGRTVPCGESIDMTKFPYVSSSRPQYRYRLVLGGLGSARLPGAGRADRRNTVGLLAQSWTRHSRGRSGGLDQRPAALARASRHCVGLRKHGCVRHSPDCGLPRSPGAWSGLLGRLLSPLVIGLPAARLPRREAQRDRPLRYRTPLSRLI